MQNQITQSTQGSPASSPRAEIIRPIRDFVLLQPEKLPEKSASGLLHLPKNAKNERYRGTVIAVGPGRVTERGIRVPIDVAPGDRVIYSRHNMAQGVNHALDENGPILVPELDIEAVIEDRHETLPAPPSTKPALE